MGQTRQVRKCLILYDNRGSYEQIQSESAVEAERSDQGLRSR